MHTSDAVAGVPHFLVVDDDAIILSSLQRIARRYAPCVAASTAAQARERLLADSWRAFVIDLQLPDGSGLELLADVRRAFPQTPALMLTGHVDGPLVNAAYDQRADVLSKPAGSWRIERFFKKAMLPEGASGSERLPSGAAGERIDALRALHTTRPLDATTRWEIGRIVAELKSQPERYGEGAVAIAASIIGEDLPSLYRHARVAERWGAEAWRTLAARRTWRGRPLSWSHLVALTPIESDAECAVWIDRVLQDDMTVRELEAALAEHVAPAITR